jgi:hypothetical protein
MFLNRLTAHANFAIIVLGLATFGVISAGAHSPIFSHFSLLDGKIRR